MKHLGFKLRKTLALFLAFSMAVSILPSNISTYAAENTEAVGEADKAKTDEVKVEEEKKEETEEVTEASEEKTEEVTEAETEEVTEQETEAVTEETTESTEEETTEATENTEATTEVTTEATEVSSEEVTTEVSSEEATTESSEEKETDEDKKKEDKKDKKKDKKKKDDRPVPTFDRIYDGVSVAGLDFSSCELLIATSDPSIFTADTDVVSEYKGIYLTRYKNSKETMYAYTYYFKRCDFIDVNSTVRANGIRNIKTPSFKKKASDTDADEDEDSSKKEDIPNDGHGEADLSDVNDGGDAIAKVATTSIGDYSGCIALVDTGAGGSNVVGSVSVLGGGAGDDNGHGSELASAIAEANPNARILSIKALNSGAVGTVADVYAGIEYAIKANVSVINLSMSSVCTQDSDTLRQAIAEAQACGITVVASAGNNGSNASYYVPASIGGVITVGACDNDGNRLSLSNFGGSVNYYVAAENTSVAAAKLSAYLVGGYDLSALDDVFTREEVEDKKEEPSPSPSLSPTPAPTEEPQATDTDAKEEDEEADKDHKHFSNLDEMLEDILTANDVTYYKKGTEQFPLHITVKLKIQNNATAENKSFSASIVDGPTIQSVSSGYKKGNYTVESGAYVYCASGHSKLNPLYSGWIEDIELTLYQVTDLGNNKYSARYRAKLPFKVPGKNENYQGIGVDVPISRVMPKYSFVPLDKAIQYTDDKGNTHKVDFTGKEIWFAVYKKSDYTDLLGYLRTNSSSGRAIALRNEDGSVVNDGMHVHNGDSKERGAIMDIAPGNSVYVKELGIKNSDGTYSKPTFTYKDSSNNDVTITVDYLAKKPLTTVAISDDPSKDCLENVTDAVYEKHEFKNESSPHFYVAARKIDKITRAPLSGATIQIYGFDNTAYGKLDKSKPMSEQSLTGSYQAIPSKKGFDNCVTYAQVDDYITSYNHYVAFETVAPGGYERFLGAVDLTINDGTVEDIIEAGDQEIGNIGEIESDEFENSPIKRYVGVRKVDSLGNPINGIKFSIVTSKTSPELVAGANTKNVTTNTEASNNIKGYAEFVFSDLPRDQVYTLTLEEVGYDTSLDTDGLAAKAWNYEHPKGSGTYPNRNKQFTMTVDTSGNYGATHEDAINSAILEQYYLENKIDKFLKVKKEVALSSICKGNPNYDVNGLEVKIYTSDDLAEVNYVGSMYVDSNGNVKQVKYKGGSIEYSTEGLSVTPYLKDAEGNPIKRTFYYTEVLPPGRENNFKPFVFTNECKVIVDPDIEDDTLFTITNTPLLDPIYLELYKVKSNGDLVGDQKLEGAQFTMKFYKQDIDSAFDPSGAVDRTWIWETKEDSGKYKIDFTDASYKKSGDDLYYDGGKVSIPKGFITIQETKAPTGFDVEGPFSITLADGTVKTADANGIIVLSSKEIEPGATGSQLFFEKVENNELRADIEFLKVNEDEEAMANVPFLLSAVEVDGTGKVVKYNDSVKVYTDENGYFSTASAYALHSDNTNGEVAECGTWFPSDGTPDDTKGALYVGTYSLKELRSSANRGNQLEKEIIFKIEDTDNGKVIKLLDTEATDAKEKIWNMKAPTVKTYASSVDTGTKMLGTDGASGYDPHNQTITDKIKYTNLRKGTDFTIKSELMVVTKDLKGKVLNVEPYMNGGSPYVVVTPFTTDGTPQKKSYLEKSGEVDVTFTGIDPDNFKPSSDNEVTCIVAYCTLYLGNYADLDAIDKAIADGTMKAAYPEFDNNDDEMDFFPLEERDPECEDQTLTITIIGTNASDGATLDNVALPSSQSTIIDKVSYSGLEIGKEYTITGTLHVKEDSAWSYKDGKFTSNLPVAEHVLTDAVGNPVTASKTFTATSHEGFIELEFTFDSSLCEGRTTVAFESIETGGVELAVHNDIRDEDQSIHFPQFKTTAKNSGASNDADDELIHEVSASKDGAFTDVIHYHNLLANRTYRAKGVLMDKNSGEALKDATGKVIEGEATFKTKEVAEVKNTDSPNSHDLQLADGTKLDFSADYADYLCDGEAELKFEGYDLTNLANTVGVVFEEIYLVSDAGDKLVGEHKDITDVDQFVSFIEIHTNAKDGVTGIKVVPLNTDTFIEDTVTYKGCKVGKKYKLTATIHVKNDWSGKYKDGDILKGPDGKDVTVDFEFTPDTADGEAVVKIPFNTAGLNYMELVVFEDMYNSLGLQVASHSQLEDNLQTVEVPGGKTTALGKDTGDHFAGVKDKVTIVDTLEFHNLEPNKEYTLKGVLYDKETNAPLLVNGAQVTNTITFTPTTKDGTVDIEFTFDSSALKGKTIVVFEDVIYKDKTVFVHHDIESKEQSVGFPSGHTTAYGKDTEDQVLPVGETVTLVDTFYYEGLIPGYEYELEGTVYSKKSKSPIKAGDEPITSTIKFTPEASSGSVEIEFTFSTELLQGATLVVFEDLYYTNPKLNVRTNIASFHDINDIEETVYVPKLGTKATINGGKNVVTDGKIAINDACKYENLVPGVKYTLEGKLMDKKTGKEVLVNGKPVTATKTFTPDEPNGTVNVIFEFDATGINGELVVFETLFHADVEVADHSDIDSKSQTVIIGSPEAEVTPKTGMAIFFIIIALIMAGGAGIIIFRKKTPVDAE
ncbi:MAG: VaFE repeat-containing surface-anchored protein [Lachnospiraceae bacterium]|nr:VaFE repeat-containing surface-anchored protein [Lachnospiraceae bacterium]